MGDGCEQLDGSLDKEELNRSQDRMDVVSLASILAQDDVPQ